MQTKIFLYTVHQTRTFLLLGLNNKRVLYFTFAYKLLIPNMKNASANCIASQKFVTDTEVLKMYTQTMNHGTLPQKLMM